MIEGIAILAVGAAILLYAEMKSNRKTIEQQDYRIRHLTGNLNEEDAEFIPDDIVEEQAKDKFKKLYGYDYKKR